MSAIMQSVTRIKYKGKYIPAYTPFEVSDEEVDMLKKSGCHVMRQTRQTSTKKVSALDSKPNK